ncbi:hypothetical protein [Exiguobacterium alkaliphilum]|uniref:Uncharacterized protein n=2 Tax=Exiguobacterium alkaliphilum TaxID=1428684 RepID=A0ABT2L0F7_9BACL|nr:hypothetical protein [Exiguobacterium alkaliphilum]MCT4795370.1 hypothetical protein [Exiguobacterium alkaliphilum]
MQIAIACMLLLTGVLWTRAEDDADANSGLLPSVTGDSLTFSGMALRFDPVNGPYIHANASHYPLGFKSAVIDSRGYLTIRRDRVDSVVSIIVDPDETLTARGITIGASGGGVVTNLYFYQNGRLLNLAKPSDYAIIAGPFSNAWVTIISQPK